MVKLEPHARWTVGCLGIALAGLAQGCSDTPRESSIATSSEAVMVCPASTTVSGIDVSEYQGTIDWNTVKSSGKAFAYARIGDGTAADTKFDVNWPAMRSSGILRGAYLFFEPATDPAMQANFVVQKVGLLGAGDLPVELDLETTGNQSASTIVANLHRCVDAITQGTGRPPIFYTTASFWSGSVQSTDFASLGLWVSSVGATCPDVPGPWTTWVFWQTSLTGTVMGITGSGSVDLDAFNGSLSALQAFANPPAHDGGTGDAAGDGDAAGNGDAGGIADATNEATTVDASSLPDVASRTDASTLGDTAVPATDASLSPTRESGLPTGSGALDAATDGGLVALPGPGWWCAAYAAPRASATGPSAISAWLLAAMCFWRRRGRCSRPCIRHTRRSSPTPSALTDSRRATACTTRAR
jgi:lysozyme